MSRYPNNWKAIAHQIKEQADWKCFKCGMQCLKPEDDLSQWSKSERRQKMLQVHHWNYDPSDNNLKT